MIKIFSPDQTFFLIESELTAKTGKHSIHINIRSKADMLLKYNEIINKKEYSEVYFINKSIPLLLKYFSSMFTIIRSAGGLVMNNKKEWLFIFRNGKWDLPKGKIEKKEGIKTAAIREVEEECGISKLTIIQKLAPTYHIYYLKGKIVLKHTYWFKMTCKDNSPLVPQTEEGITDVKWLKTSQLGQVYKNTFGSIIEVLKNIDTSGK